MLLAARKKYGTYREIEAQYNEETGDVANIRRVDYALCQPVSPQVLEQSTPALQAGADRCEQAKERLFAAKTPEEVEVARQVMDIMCND